MLGALEESWGFEMPTPPLGGKLPGGKAIPPGTRWGGLAICSGGGGGVGEEGEGTLLGAQSS